MSRAKIGLALGSGAARGWAHIGIIAALAEMDIVPDIVCGTSMGALVGAAYVAGRLDQLRQKIETFNWRDIIAMLDVQITAGGLIEGVRVGTLLRDLGIPAVEIKPVKPIA